MCHRHRCRRRAAPGAAALLPAARGDGGARSCTLPAARQGAALLQRAPARLGLVAVEGGRIPDLEGAATADEGCELADARMLDQHRGQDDAALAVEGKLLGIAEQGRRQIVMLVGEEVYAAQLLVDLVEPFEAAALDGAVLEGGQGGDALESIGGKLLAIGRRDRNAPFPVELVDECVEEQSHAASAVPTPLPSPGPLLHLLGRRNLGRPDQNLPAAGTVCGYSWDTMGSYGGQWEWIVKSWYFRALRRSWHGL